MKAAAGFINWIIQFVIQAVKQKLVKSKKKLKMIVVVDKFLFKTIIQIVWFRGSKAVETSTRCILAENFYLNDDWHFRRSLLPRPCCATEKFQKFLF